MPPRSILKNSTPASEAKPVNQRHLEIALHHANIIHDQKKVEEQILQATITLMDFPTVSSANPARPSHSDATTFQTLLIPFQPSDYDSLIEERNLADRCGYALCPKPPRRLPKAGRKTFADGEDGVKIVDKKLLEMWCSNDCAKRALYIKVQLKEEPAWLRRGGIGDKIELMVDKIEEQHGALPIRPKPKEKGSTDEGLGQDEDDEEQAWKLREEALAELAIERGEKPGSVDKSKEGLIKDTIEERGTTKAPKPPSAPASSAHLAIEGHIPKADMKKQRKGEEDEDEDEEDNDWGV